MFQVNTSFCHIIQFYYDISIIKAPPSQCDRSAFSLITNYSFSSLAFAMSSNLRHKPKLTKAIVDRAYAGIAHAL